MGTLTYLSADNQVTIPADVCAALGVKPGEAVEIERRGDEVVIRKGVLDEAERERRREEMRERIRLAVEKYGRPMDQTTDEYMAEIREPLP